jgi:hypothetical protein
MSEQLQRNEPSSHRAFYSRSYAPLHKVRSESLFQRAIAHLLPWTIFSYPGIKRGSLAIFRDKAPYETTRHWRKGTRNPPQWAIDTLADQIEARSLAGLAIVAELRALEPKKHRPSGFTFVDPETGKDKRNRGVDPTERPV